jgi:hypothetical protein
MDTLGDYATRAPSAGPGIRRKPSVAVRSNRLSLGKRRGAPVAKTNERQQASRPFWPNEPNEGKLNDATHPESMAGMRSRRDPLRMRGSDSNPASRQPAILAERSQSRLALDRSEKELMGVASAQPHRTAQVIWPNEPNGRSFGQTNPLESFGRTKPLQGSSSRYESEMMGFGRAQAILPQQGHFGRTKPIQAGIGARCGRDGGASEARPLGDFGRMNPLRGRDDGTRKNSAPAYGRRTISAERTQCKVIWPNEPNANMVVPGVRGKTMGFASA